MEDPKMSTHALSLPSQRAQVSKRDREAGMSKVVPWLSTRWRTLGNILSEEERCPSLGSSGKVSRRKQLTLAPREVGVGQVSEAGSTCAKARGQGTWRVLVETREVQCDRSIQAGGSR